MSQTLDEVDVMSLSACQKALEWVPLALAKFHVLLPIKYEKGVLTVVVPQMFTAVGWVEYLTNQEVVYIRGDEKAILQAIDRFYHIQNQKEIFTEPIESITPDINTGRSTIEIWLNKLLTIACEKSVSDIHIEPLEKNFQIRFRIDGELELYSICDFNFYASILSELKLLTRLSIDQKRLPQDGRFTWNSQGKRYTIRLSILPSIRGETIALRILSESTQLEISNLGFTAVQQTQVEQLMRTTHGLILVAGPTGSGKTTTLYSLLKALQKSSRKIITIEDPIEYQLKGVTQVPVNMEWGTTFSAALRSILRQAPDVIMIGEIRDAETAQIAINAALTGHLIFATIHASDAFSAIYRLIDLGIEGPLLVSALKAVVSQRLIRKNCTRCCQVTQPMRAEVEYLNINSNSLLKRGMGCKGCHHLGYKGRTGIFEVLEMDSTLQTLIQQNQPVAVLQETMVQKGFLTMKTTGVQKILEGLTTVDAVISSLLTVDTI